MASLLKNPLNGGQPINARAPTVKVTNVIGSFRRSPPILQNIWKMGGLRRKLPITFVTFTVGALALIGCPPFSGFFSKDAILALAYERNMPIFAVALFTAFLTAFYVIRMLVIAFFGNPRSDSARESRESPPGMTLPVMVLAVLAAVGG